jgi:hypothetical protein
MDFALTEEYHCWASRLTAMTSDFASAVLSTPLDITAASKLIKNYLGSD